MRLDHPRQVGLARGRGRARTAHHSAVSRRKPRPIRCSGRQTVLSPRSPTVAAWSQLAAQWGQVGASFPPARTERRALPVRRRADTNAAGDLPAPVVPGYVRDRRGTWRYAATGRAVPGARDLTLRALHRFAVHRAQLLVPVDLVRTEAELAWCLAWKHTLTTSLRDGHLQSVVRVPAGEWERRADVPFGLWAPELAPTRLLAVGEVARLVGVSAATITAYLCRGRMP